MSRFGMPAEDLKTLAQLMADVILHSRDVKEKVRDLRKKYLDLQFCFNQNDIGVLMDELHRAVKM